MKKLIFILLLLLSISSLFATDFTVDGINYTTVTSSTVQVSQGTYSGSITIPSSVTYNNITYSVTSIGYSAFSGCTGLTSITIPSCVTSIGNNAFYGCSGLTSITIPTSITSIGSSTFYGCTGLTDITIPSLVTFIGDYAFSGCTGLTSIIIPSSVTTIGFIAFYGCTCLINVDSNNPNYASQDGLLYNKTMTTLIKYPLSKTGNFSIPSSVTSIGGNAFSGCTGLTSITIPSSVISISNSAFSACSGLTSITIPSSVTIIGYSAFKDCTGLTTLNYNAINCTSMGSYPNPVFIGCTKLASVIIDDNVKTIPQNAFWGCTGLTNITIPSSITSIGDYAFYGCSSLTSITIPSSVTSIGSGAFMLCAGLIYVDANNPNYTSQDGLLYNKAMTTLIKCPLVKTGEFSIPSSITSIGDYAFYGCTGLTSINIPQSVNTIGNVSFQGCTGLINIDANNPNYASLDGLLYNKTMTTLIQCPLAKTGNLTIPSFVTSIGSNAFFSCSHLTTITIPSSVLSIGSGAFSNCTGLSNITIPSSVTSIGDLAFQGCTGLTTVNFNAIYCTRMGSLSYPVFSGCTNLTNVIIGDIVNIIPAYAFIVCRGLTSITFPSSVTSIGSNAFSDCTGITTIYTYATVPVSLWGNSGVFYNVNKITCILYVPKGSLSAYKAADFWNDFVNIVEFDASAVNTPNDTKLKLIYNPAAGSLQLNGLDSPVLVSVYDLNGHLCLSRTVRAGETLPVQSLPRGIYVVKAVLNNEVMSRKVVI